MEIQLRVILLGVGLLILLVVAYDFFRRKPAHDTTSGGEGRKQRENQNRSNPSVRLDSDYDDSLRFTATDPESNLATSAMPESFLRASIVPTQGSNIHGEPAALPVTVVDEEDEFPPQHLITISIMSRDPYGFLGADLLDALEGAQMQFGKGEIFHRVDGDSIIFSIASAIEPGRFILETMVDEHVPGITLIQLPENLSNPAKGFEQMIRAAKQIAFALNGELLDHDRQHLTLETIELYRKEAEAITRRR
ncbi:MAG TPA: cell division protein ZipA C-terminal FtsZ-binding domain-containing protein [Gammaproteobacteria bacterium]|nr:cell division protein ZipA C-terminal FtsZ-binding domain-containing protein [Gammaproteobacteria bacterium]